MKVSQAMTPKYWVGHNRNSDDVFLDTAGKTLDNVDGKMIAKFGEAWRENYPDYDIVLIELRMIGVVYEKR